jgi:4-amino-4-deoxy-L-arabinose transferase-like glycosyltransferase
MVASVVSFAILLLDRAPRETDALALLVPLAIPAGAAAMTLRRGAANALSWFSLITFGLLALAIWVMWIAMQTGFPARLAANVARLEPGFVPTLGVDTLLIALAFTATWIWFVCRAELTTLRSLPFWASGIALIWGLAMTLWIGWIDYGKTYRPVAEGIAAQLATHRGCVASRGLGDVQRAAFHYHAGILTQRLEIGPEASACRLLLIQTTDVARASLPRAEWQLLWEGGRPRDRERYWLYRRLD